MKLSKGTITLSQATDFHVAKADVHCMGHENLLRGGIKYNMSIIKSQLAECTICYVTSGRKLLPYSICTWHWQLLSETVVQRMQIVRLAS